MGELWTCYGTYQKGEYHKKNQMECQDRIAYKNEGNRQAMALVDGSGETDCNTVAGKMVADALVNFLLTSFDRIKGETKYNIGNSLMREVYDIIFGLMKEYHLPADEFRSTLLGVCIDQEKGEYCAIHLGDGVIVGREDQYKIISYPFNGVREGETCLTLSDHVLEKMKLFYGKVGNLRSIALCSDGVYETRKNLGNVFSCIEEFKTTRTLKEREDDQGIIILEMPQ